MVPTYNSDIYTHTLVRFGVFGQISTNNHFRVPPVLIKIQ